MESKQATRSDRRPRYIPLVTREMVTARLIEIAKTDPEFLAALERLSRKEHSK